MDRTITVYPGASERVETGIGEPFAAAPTSYALVSPTSGGKSIILSNIFCKFYLDKSGNSLFQRIFLFSPTVRLDDQYKTLIKLIEKLCPGQKREPCIFPEFSMEKLGAIIEEQRQIVAECRKRKLKPPQIAIILDDLGERAEILQARRGGASGGSHVLSLAFSGRHSQITRAISVQKLMLSRGIIANVRCLVVGRLRSKHEIEVLAEELSGLAGSKDAALALIEYATREPFSFLFCRLDAKDRESTFWLRFERRLTVEDSVGKEQSESDGEDGPIGRRPLGKRSGAVQQAQGDGPRTGNPAGPSKRKAGK